MELRIYWKVLRRRWWLPLGLVLLVAAGATIRTLTVGSSYVASLRLVVSAPTQQVTGDFAGYDPAYYAWLTSEYLVDDFSEVMKSHQFAADVAEALGERSEAASIKEATRTLRTHRIVTVRVGAPTAAEARRVGFAVAKVIRERSSDYFAQLQVEGARAEIIDPPSVYRDPSMARAAIEIAVYVALALVVGILLALLLHYLDDALYEAQEVEQELGLRVLGQIPPES